MKANKTCPNCGKPIFSIPDECSEDDITNVLPDEALCLNYHLREKPDCTPIQEVIQNIIDEIKPQIELTPSKNQSDNENEMLFDTGLYHQSEHVKHLIYSDIDRILALLRAKGFVVNYEEDYNADDEREFFYTIEPYEVGADYVAGFISKITDWFIVNEMTEGRYVPKKEWEGEYVLAVSNWDFSEADLKAIAPLFRYVYSLDK